MASTYSNLKIQLMATGENTGTWGNVTNDNLGAAIEQALVETATVTFASANQTLTLTDTNARQNARALRLNLTGTTGGARDLIVPAIQKPYIVNNGTADIITVKVSGQTGVAVPASTSMLLYNNGTDVVVAFNRVVGNVVGNVTGNVTGTASNATVLQTARNIQISGGVTAANVSFNGSAAVDLNVTAINVGTATAGTLAVARGGTGANTLTNNSVIIGNTTGAVKFVAPGTDGNVLTSNGTAWVSEAISTGGDYVMQVFTSPGTWTKPAGLKAVKVTVVGGGGGSSVLRGGNGGGGGGTSIEYLDAPAIPGPQPYTVGTGGTAGTGSPGAGGAGNTSSFGGPTAFLSATGGTGGPVGAPPVAAGGTGSNGQLNIAGSPAVHSSTVSTDCPPVTSNYSIGGGTFLGGNNNRLAVSNLANIQNPGGPLGYGVGGQGLTIPGTAGQTGGAGVVIVEEFY